MDNETREDRRARRERRTAAIEQDYRELLSTDAGRRVLGGFFHACGANSVTLAESPAAMAYQQGMRAAALLLSNRIRQIDPRLVGECELAWSGFLKRFEIGDDE